MIVMWSRNIHRMVANVPTLTFWGMSVCLWRVGLEYGGRNRIGAELKKCSRIRDKDHHAELPTVGSSKHRTMVVRGRSRLPLAVSA